MGYRKPTGCCAKKSYYLRHECGKRNETRNELVQGSEKLAMEKPKAKDR